MVTRVSWVHFKPRKAKIGKKKRLTPFFAQKPSIRMRLINIAFCQLIREKIFSCKVSNYNLIIIQICLNCSEHGLRWLNQIFQWWYLSTLTNKNSSINSSTGNWLLHFSRKMRNFSDEVYFIKIRVTIATECHHSSFYILPNYLTSRLKFGKHSLDHWPDMLKILLGLYICKNCYDSIFKKIVVKIFGVWLQWNQNIFWLLLKNMSTAHDEIMFCAPLLCTIFGVQSIIGFLWGWAHQRKEWLFTLKITRWPIFFFLNNFDPSLILFLFKELEKILHLKTNLLLETRHLRW